MAPSYDYECTSENCDNGFEHYQSIVSDPLKHCEKCNKDTLKRLIGKGGAVIFKGSGFYINDSKKSSSLPAD